MGPAGDGVLQTSGNAVPMPLLDACTTVRMFTFTVAGIARGSYQSGLPVGLSMSAALRASSSDAHHASTGPGGAQPRENARHATATSAPPDAAPTSPQHSAGCESIGSPWKRVA